MTNSTTYPMHPILTSDVIGADLRAAIDHGVMSVSSSSNPLSETHYWICTLAIIDAFVVELEQFDGADMFYFTPFTSMDPWTQSSRGAPLYRDDVSIAPSTEHIGKATSGFLLLPLPVQLSTPIKLAPSFKCPLQHHLIFALKPYLEPRL